MEVPAKPELRRAEPLCAFSRKSRKSRKSRTRSSRKKRSHKPEALPSPKKLDFEQETATDNPESSSRPKPSKARHLKDPWVKGSSFDSCWRFCATLGEPTPETSSLHRRIRNTPRTPFLWATLPVTPSRAPTAPIVEATATAAALPSRPP